VAAFADALEKAATATIERGLMTGDLARLADPAAARICSTQEFIAEIAAELARS
jgi:isocitrate dehydrogenase